MRGRTRPPSRSKLTPESVYAAALAGVLHERRYAAGGYGSCGGSETVGEGVSEGVTESEGATDGEYEGEAASDAVLDGDAEGDAI